MGISEKGRLSHWAFETVLLANPSLGIRPELTPFRDFAVTLKIKHVTLNIQYLENS